MQIVYLVVLMLSAILVAAGFLRIYYQLAPVFHRDRAVVGATLTLPILGFLTIISTPPSVLMAALLLMLVGVWDEWRGVSRTMGLALTLLAASIGIMRLPAVNAVVLPAPLIVLGVWLCWWGLTLAAEYVPQRVVRCFLVLALAWVPLVLAVLLGFTSRHVALDVVMIASSMFGALLVVKRDDRAAIALRLPLLFLLGYSIWRTLLAGAWPFALASLALLLAGLFVPRLAMKRTRPVAA